MSDFEIQSRVVRDMLAILEHGEGSRDQRIKAAKAIFVAASEAHEFNEMTRQVILNRFWRAAGLMFKELS